MNYTYFYFIFLLILSTITPYCQWLGKGKAGERPPPLCGCRGWVGGSVERNNWTFWGLMITIGIITSKFCKISNDYGIFYFIF